MMRSPIVFIAVIVIQIVFWYGMSIPTIWEEGWQGTRNIQPKTKILEKPHSKQMADILSFGDQQFYFRIRALLLQNAGDTYGRFT